MQIDKFVVLKPSVGILDIETTSLDADTGYVICIGLLDVNKDRARTFFAKRPDDEKKIMTAFFKVLDKYHVLFTWNGSSFDLPYLTTRALLNSVDFSSLFKVKHIDLAEITRKSLRLSSTSMWNVCRYFGIEYDEDIGGSEVPMRYLNYMAGRRGLRSIIIRHCLMDLRRTKAIMTRLKPLVYYLNPDLPTLP